MPPAKAENARVPACCLEQHTIFSANKSAVTGRGLFLFFAAQDARHEDFFEIASKEMAVAADIEADEYTFLKPTIWDRKLKWHLPKA